MNTPEVLLPANRVDIDIGEGPAQAVKCLMDAECRVMSLNIVGRQTVAIRLPFVIPDWSQWEDNTGGVVQVMKPVDQSDLTVLEPYPTAAVDIETGEQMSAFSTDGAILRANVPGLIMLGFNKGFDFKALWAVTNCNIGSLATGEVIPEIKYITNDTNFDAMSAFYDKLHRSSTE